MEIYELGVDIKSDWEFVDGDLILVSDIDNLTQSIANRLNTQIGTMSDFYNTYGSIVDEFVGKHSDKKTLSFLRIEIETTLKQDPRLSDVTVELEYIGNGAIRIDVTNIYNDDSDLTESFVLDKNGEVLIDGS